MWICARRAGRYERLLKVRRADDDLARSWCVRRRLGRRRRRHVRVAGRSVGCARIVERRWRRHVHSYIGLASQVLRCGVSCWTIMISATSCMPRPCRIALPSHMFAHPRSSPPAHSTIKAHSLGSVPVLHSSLGIPYEYNKASNERSKSAKRGKRKESIYQVKSNPIPQSVPTASSTYST